MNVGAWDVHHGALREPLPYGADDSYATLAKYLTAGREDAPPWCVEDWGCGGGGLSRFIPLAHYRGVDGSASPFAQEYVDLTEYRSTGFDIALRHVLEHNDNWQAVLTNACRSFHRRLGIVLFTPTVERTHVMFREPAYHDVPVIAFNIEDVLAVIRPYAEQVGASIEFTTVDSPGTAFGVETFIFVTR